MQLVQSFKEVHDERVKYLEKKLNSVIHRNVGLSEKVSECAKSREQYRCEVHKMKRELKELRDMEELEDVKMQLDIVTENVDNLLRSNAGWEKSEWNVNN